jgi:hypothetical protein
MPPFSSKKKRGRKPVEHADGDAEVEKLALEIALLPGSDLDMVYWYTHLTALQQASFVREPSVSNFGFIFNLEAVLW